MIVVFCVVIHWVVSVFTVVAAGTLRFLVLLPLFGGCYPFVTLFAPKNGENVGNLRTFATCQLSLDSPDFDVSCSALHPHKLRNISAFRLIIQSLSHWADSNRRPTHYEGFSRVENQRVARGENLDVTQKFPQIIKIS